MLVSPPPLALDHHRLVSVRLRAERIALMAFAVEGVTLAVRACHVPGGGWEPPTKVDGDVAGYTIALTITGHEAHAVLVADLLAGGLFPFTPPVVVTIDARWPGVDLTAALDAELAHWSPERSSLADVLARVAGLARHALVALPVPAAA